MENIPLIIQISFVLITILTIGLFYQASRNNKPLLGLLIFLAIIQGVLAYTGFYTTFPLPVPRMATILAPAIMLMVFGFTTQKGRSIIDQFDMTSYTYLHTIRVFVEFVLLGLFLYHTIPQSMTFEGRNFDILSGLTAPLIAYFGFQKKKISRFFLVFWNIACLLLVLQVVTTGILSVPTTFQQLSFDQPNIAVLYFPFIWLPGIVVPIVIFGHLVSLRKLLKSQ